MLRVLRFPDPETSPQADRLRERGIQVIGLPGLAPCGLGSRWRAFRLGRRVAGRRSGPVPDLIHATGFDAADLAVELAERWRRPYVLSADAFLLPGHRLRIARRWFRGVIAPDDDLRDDLARELGLPARWIGVIPPGLALSEPLDRRGSGRVPVVGTAAGAGVGSGLATFLQAAAMVGESGLDVEFVVAHAGDPGFTRGLAEGLDVADRLTIAEDAELDRMFWPVLDLYCQPARWPSPGASLASALSRGLPAIASDLPGLRGVADEGRAARLVPPGDAVALASAIRESLADPEAARAFGLRGQAWIAARHDPAREAQALAAFYEAATTVARPSPRVRADAPDSGPVASLRS